MSDNSKFTEYRDDEKLDDSTADSEHQTSFVEQHPISDASTKQLSPSVTAALEQCSVKDITPTTSSSASGPVHDSQVSVTAGASSLPISVDSPPAAKARPQSDPFHSHLDSPSADLSKFFRTPSSSPGPPASRPSSQDIDGVFHKTGLAGHTPPYSSPSVLYQNGHYVFQTPTRPTTRPPFVPRSVPLRPPTLVLPNVEQLLNSRVPPTEQQLRACIQPIRHTRAPRASPPNFTSHARFRRRLFIMDAEVPQDHAVTVFTDGDESKNIPSLPPFPFDDHKIDESPSASVSYKQHLVSQLQSIYDQYDTLKLTITLTMAKGVEDAQKPALANQRTRLHTLWHKARTLVPKIKDIIAVQAKNRPSLEVFPDPPSPDPIDYSSMTDFMKNNLTKPDGSARPLREIWEKLRLYAIDQNVSHESFKTALLSCVTDDVYMFLKEYKDLPLAKLAKRLANRFVTEQPLLDATNALHAFSRAQNEPLRQSVARLQALVDRVLITHPPQERDVLREHHTIHHLRNMIAPKTRKFLDSKIAEYQTQGLRLKLDDMIKFCSQEESRSGLPSTDLANPVSLYHVDTPAPYPPAPDPADQTYNDLSHKVDQVALTLDHKVDQLTDLVLDMSQANVKLCQSLSLVDHTEDDPEVNALTRGQYRNQPRTDAKTLTKPSEPTNTTRNRANQQRQNSRNRRDQQTGRLRNISDNIATQANSIPSHPLTKKAKECIGLILSVNRHRSQKLPRPRPNTNEDGNVKGNRNNRLLNDTLLLPEKFSSIQYRSPSLLQGHLSLSLQQTTISKNLILCKLSYSNNSSNPGSVLSCVHLRSIGHHSPPMTTRLLLFLNKHSSHGTIIDIKRSPCRLARPLSHTTSHQLLHWYKPMTIRVSPSIHPAPFVIVLFLMLLRNVMLLKLL